MLRWGEPRFTRDVDAALLTGFGNEDHFVAAILEAGFSPRISGAAEFALRSRTLLVETGGVPLDITLAAFPFEADSVERATYFELEPGCRLRTCSAEDLLVYKLFSDRDKDYIDARNVVIRQRGLLDWAYISGQLSSLAASTDDSSILVRFARAKALTE